MTRTELFYLLPYVVSLGLSTGILLYVWQRRHIQGSNAFVWFVAGQLLWTLAYVIELLSPTLSEKIFWDGTEWLASGIVIVAFPAFAVQYTKFKLPNPRALFWLSLIIPLLYIPLVITDGTYHWLRINPHLNTVSPLPEVEYFHTSLAVGFYFYGYIIATIGLSLLFQHFLQPHNLFRAQVATIIIGFLTPALGTILSLLGFQLTPWQDPIPISIAIGNLILIWGIYRFQIFDVIPVGRDKVFEDLVDPVVILNNQNLVIDINCAMLDLIGKEANDVIGQSAKEVFIDSPIPIKMYTDVTHARIETMFELHNKTISYELTVWPMYDRQRKLVGRIFISHDITALKELEQTLRNLNTELEQRVQARTEDLATAYDTTLEGWAKTLEFRDKETEGHSRRVTETTLKIARALEIPEDELVHIYRGALLHDIGKMAIPDEILRKTGPLTHEERTIIRKHPEIAHQLLEPIPFLKKAMEIPYCHHEKWDGTGYPRGLKGREIPVSARIFTVADVWDAVQYDRPYKKGWPREKAIQYLKENDGTHFDPHVVDIFLRMIEKGEI